MADSDLQIRGGGGWRVADHPDPEIRRGGIGPGLKKIFLGPSGLSLV